MFISLLINLLFSCACNNTSGNSPDVDPQPEAIIPSNLTLEITVTGADANNPNGNGSGIINCVAKATDAVKYGFRFGTGSEVESTTGNITHTYTTGGTITYTVYVYAYSKTGHSTNVSKKVTVYVKTLDFTNLVWSDEFNTNGKPDASKWNYDIGTGSGGWGNNELQYYTDRLENAKVENGLLIITAKKENYQGSEYTSARLKTKGKFAFKYGKIEFRAKLPYGVGTWPALWMLGNDIDNVGWPACGEIDVMEHVGRELNKIYGTVHYPDHAGGNAVGGTVMINNVTSEFHIYSAEWDDKEIRFYVDNNLFFTFSNSSNIPFNHDFFIIMNCAIGGNFGGTVDPAFSSGVFEIDYVRVYR